jgi:hypothetical protein
MPLGSAMFPGLAEAFGVGESSTMVDVLPEDDRLNVFARGAKCVSRSSKGGQRGGMRVTVRDVLFVSFQDMVTGSRQQGGV